MTRVPTQRHVPLSASSAFPLPGDASTAVGDVRFEDPFRELERETAAVLAWQAELDDQARQALSSIAGMGALRQAVARELAASLVGPPVAGGPLWFSRHRSETDGRYREIWASPDPAQDGTRIAAAADVGIDDPSIDWFAPSPSGSHVAFGVASGGDELCTLFLVDVATREIVRPDGVPECTDDAAWLPDGSAVLCLSNPEPHALGKRPRLTAVDTEGVASSVALPQLDLPRLWLQVSRDGRYIGLLGGSGFAQRLVAVKDCVSDVWLSGLSTPGVVLRGHFAGDRYVALTTVDAPRGRVVDVPVGCIGDIDTWKELVAESPGVLRVVTPLGEDMVLCEYRDGASRLRRVNRHGQQVGVIPLPEASVVTGPAFAPTESAEASGVAVGDDALILSCSSALSSPRLLRYDAISGRVAQLLGPASTLTEVSFRSCQCTSSDGATVHYQLFAPSDVRLPVPTVIAAYGGWNYPMLGEAYLGVFTPIVKAGGAVAIANLRGDGTFGAEQWHAGRREAKQQSFDDLYAVAEDLLASDIALPDRIGLWGASNGGLLGGVALTQRPKLFRAVAALVPLFDMCRFIGERFGATTISEYGDPRRLEDARWLRAFSPYHNVDSGETYPATLIVSGRNDCRVAEWHARKMVAALRRANSGPDRVLFRAHANRGHGTLVETATAWLHAEWLGFLMHELGLPLPSSDAAA